MKALAILALAAAGVVPVGAADTDSVDSVVRTVYEVISGPAGPRDWPRFRALFADGARLIAIRVNAGVATPTVMTPDEFAQRSGANAEKNAFYEAPVAQRVEMFGNIAHVFSTYESRRAPGDKPFARGINSFQLVRAGGSWKVMTILWDSEREDSPIPEKYLK
ncbi:MAG TPA: hypothetical protein VMH28_04910 [Candidatus Acidoferrales bacterium]|nr:hypothetical protein [Candidatus Acidoferrales bacterium]